MKKILFVFGTRPEAIKMAPLVKAFQEQNHVFQTKVCVTGQPNQDLYDITLNILVGMKTVFQVYRPDYLFVDGDTTTTFAASLAAFYEKIIVGHVEAGLRAGNIYSPWPEEANRKLTSQLRPLSLYPNHIKPK